MEALPKEFKVSPLTMLPGATLRLACTVISVLIMTLYGSHALAASGAPVDLKTSLVRKWKAQRTEIVTGHFEIKLFRYFDPSLKTLSRERLIQIIESLKPSLGLKDEVGDLIRQSLPKEGWISSQWGVPVTLDVDREKVRNVWRMPIPGKGIAEEVKVFDGTTETAYLPENKQADLFAGQNNFELLRVAGFRFVPFVEDSDVGEMRILSEAGEAVDVKCDRLEITVDPSSGFVRHATYRNPQNQITYELWQFKPTAYPGDITLPSLSVVVQSYGDSAVRLMSIYQVEKASLNIAIPPSAFIVDIPAGTQGIDHREDRNKPLFKVAAKSEEDVSKFMDQAKIEWEESQKATKPVARSWKRIIAGFTALGLVIGALLLWRRRSPTAQARS